MYILKYILSFVIILHTSKAIESDEINEDDESRIVGGSNASKIIGYQASLRNECMRHFCAGVIISNRWIITAAHCLVGGNAKYVSVGTIYMTPDFQLYIVQRTIMNPGYDPTLIINDIGLIQTASRIYFNGRVWKINLPALDIRNNIQLQIAGWGRTNFPGDLANILQIAKVRTISNDECEELLNRTISSKNLCAYGGFGIGLCHGDSGGPLVYGNVLHGIISYGRPCAIGYPDVYTRVYKFLTWIRTEMRFYQDTN